VNADKDNEIEDFINSEDKATRMKVQQIPQLTISSAFDIYSQINIASSSKTKFYRQTH
jgi:uncharacterized protein YutE (UPF0331/DUF86 family)